MELINKLTEKQKANFWSKVDKSAGDNACWPYLGCKDRKGYGRKAYNIDGKNIHYSTHRLALILHTGQCSEDLLALHAPVICHNTSCCNPSHLRWGTNSDNALDKNIDGTMKINFKPQIGEKNGCAKLTEQKVREIRELYSNGNSIRSIAKQYSAGKTTIANIVHNRKWKHVI